MFDFFLTILHVVLVSGMILVSIIVLKRSRKEDAKPADQPSMDSARQSRHQGAG
jgi:hypothetical protein